MARIRICGITWLQLVLHVEGCSTALDAHLTVHTGLDTTLIDGKVWAAELFVRLHLRHAAGALHPARCVFMCITPRQGYVCILQMRPPGPEPAFGPPRCFFCCTVHFPAARLLPRRSLLLRNGPRRAGLLHPCWLHRGGGGSMHHLHSQYPPALAALPLCPGHPLPYWARADLSCMQPVCLL